MLRLEKQGLIRSRKVRRTTGAYAVDMAALRQLLSSPLPECDFLPGFTPIPALAQLQPVESPADDLTDAT